MICRIWSLARLGVIKEGATQQGAEDNQTATCKAPQSNYCSSTFAKKLLIYAKADFILREHRFVCVSQDYLDQYLCQKHFFITWQTLSGALHENAWSMQPVRLVIRSLKPSSRPYLCRNVWTGEPGHGWNAVAIDLSATLKLRRSLNKI